MSIATKTLLLLLLLASTALAERKRDPLTAAEADQLREVAMEPYKRLKLYIKFTDARLDSLDQLRADPKAADGRGKKIHDMLEDFTALMDEINDNLDQYEGRPLSDDDRKGFRKGLKEVLLACDRFDARLRALKNAAQNDPQTQREAQDFRFALQDAQDALKSSMDIAREYAETGDKDQGTEKKK